MAVITLVIFSCYDSDFMVDSLVHEFQVLDIHDYF